MHTVDLMAEITAANHIVIRSVRRILGPAHQSDVEDVMQMAALNAFKVNGTKSGFKGKSKFSTWFTRVAVNQALMMRRRYIAKAEVGLQDLLPDPQDPLERMIQFESQVQPADEAVLENERRQALMEAIGRMKSPSLRDAARRIVRDEFRSENGTEKARKFRLKVALRQDERLREVILGERNSNVSSGRAAPEGAPC